jgi:nucleoid-associated protein YgaU
LFEHEAKNSSKVASKNKANGTSNQSKKTVKTVAKPEKTPNAKTPGKVAKAKEEKAAVPERNIDPSEFKKLRTIDEELIIYVIKDGDTLKSIAKKYYGVATKERAIADLNFIDNPNTVKVGEEIIVDVKPLGKSEKVKSAFKNSTVSKLFAPEGKTTYTIRKGDTLGKIARQFFGKSTAAGKLMKANPGLNPRNLRIGDVLIIPDSRGDNA